MKKLILILCLFLITGCSTSPKPLYNDGEYFGVGSGKCGSIQVKVTIAEGNITAIEVVKSNETNDYMKEAEEYLIPKIIENNTTEGIDSVTGATESSSGLLHAVYAALQEAKPESKLEGNNE